MILIFSCFIPMVNFVTIPMLTSAIVYLYVKLDFKRFALVYVLNVGVLAVLGGPALMLLLMLPLFFLPASIVLASGYKGKVSAYRAILASGLTLVAEMVLLLVGLRLAGYDAFGMLKDNFNEMLNILPKGTVSPTAVDAFFFTFQQISPFLMLFMGACFAFASHAVCRLLLTRMDVAVPKLPPMRSLRLPRSTVIYFVAVMMPSLFVRDGSSVLAMISYNLLPVLLVLLSLQALSFLFFLVAHFRLNKAIPWLVVVLLVFWSGALYIAAFVGVLDILFPLRARLTDKS